MADLKRFGLQMKELRERKNWSQDALAVKTACSQPTISKLENDPNQSLSMGMALRLASVLEMPVIELVRGTDLEEQIKKEWLYPRYCCNHDPILVFSRFQNGFEIGFCPECGQELAGNCPKCGTARDVNWENYCAVCGYAFTENPSRITEWLMWNVDTKSGEAFDEAFFVGREGQTFIYPARVCWNRLHHSDEHINYVNAFGCCAEHKYCDICGEKLLDTCPQCSKPLFGAMEADLLYCSGCGAPLAEGVLKKEKAIKTSVPPHAVRLKWTRLSKSSRDLRLQNPQDFEVEIFGQLLNNFRRSVGKVNKNMLAVLIELKEDPSQTTLPGDGDLRSGYIGLNRWCLSNSPRHQKSIAAARALWRFLFNENQPTQLADPGPNGKLVLRVDNWEEWYQRMVA